MAHDVFISYTHQDKPQADAVCAILESRGIRCWIAPRDITPGEEWGAAIVEAIKSARVMVLLFSSHANASPQIRREVQLAVHAETVLIPLRIEDVAPLKSLEYFLGTPHWLDALTAPFESHLDRLAAAVMSFLAVRGAGSDAQPAESEMTVGATRSASSVSDAQAALRTDPPPDIAAPTRISRVNTDVGSPAQPVDAAAARVTLSVLWVPLDPTSVAVDTAGNIYVTIVAPFKPSRVLKFAAGAETPTELPFAGLVAPSAVAVDSDCAVYVADSHTNRVLKLANGVATPLPFSDLKKPHGLAIDTAGNVYVADTGNKRVLRLAQNSDSLTALPFADLEKPSGVAVDTAGNVYVADTGNKRVLRLAQNTYSLTALPFADLKKPSGVAVDTAGNVYVGDDRSGGVWKLAADVPVPVKLSSGLKGLDIINAVAVDTAGNVYVAVTSIPRCRIVIRSAGAA